MTIRVVPPDGSPPEAPGVQTQACQLPLAQADGSDEERWLPFQKLDVYRLAKEFVRLVHQAKITDAELRDQATRAAKRTFLGLCEGLPIDGQAMRRKYFTESHASLHETLGAIDLCATIGAAREADAVMIQRLGVRLKHMLRALLH